MAKRKKLFVPPQVDRKFAIGEKVYCRNSIDLWNVLKFSYTSVIDGAKVPRYDIVAVTGSNRGRRRSDVLETELIKKRI